jgi:site-specific DNA recombinase
MSVLPLKADMLSAERDVRFVPQGDKSTSTTCCWVDGPALRVACNERQSHRYRRGYRRRNRRGGAVGRDYLACSAARGSGTCSSRQSIRRAALEGLILTGLRQCLMAPELVEEFIRAFHQEINLQRREDDVLREAKRRELADVEHKLNGLIDAIADGLRGPGLQQRLDGLETRRSEIEKNLATGPVTPVRLHPNLAQVYRQQVEHLQQALADPQIRDEAAEVLRGLVEHVLIGPAANGLEIEIVGEIAKMVELSLGLDAKQANLDERLTRSVKVVAGTGFEPVTFRL